MSGTTNGNSPRRASRPSKVRTGVRLADLAEEHEAEQITFADTQGPPGSGDHLAGMVRIRDGWSPLLAVHHQRGTQEALAHPDGADALLLDHDWMTELGEGLPVYRPPLNMAALFAEPAVGNVSDGSAGQGVEGLTVRYLTPHNKWSIHSEYQDNLFMLSLSRGGQNIWMSDRDAAKVGIEDDNDWIEAVNRNGVVVPGLCAIASHRMPEGTVYMYHAQDRLIDVPIAETLGKRGGHPQLADPPAGQAKPPDRRVRPADLRVQLPRAHGQPARRGHRHPQALTRRGVLTRRRDGPDGDGDEPRQVHRMPHLFSHLQAGLDQPIRQRAIPVNNVETRPGLGYP